MKISACKIRNTGGFTLVETLIGLMILTIAVVAATSLSIGLLRSNKFIVENLQAHYLAQEGLEAVRNIRDTNWMHNLNWKDGKVDFLGEIAVPENGDMQKYIVGINVSGFGSAVVADQNIISSLPKTWFLVPYDVGSLSESKIYLCGGEGETNFQYFSNAGGCEGGEMTEFSRYIEVSKPDYCFDDSGVQKAELEDLCKNAMLVKSIVEFNEGKAELTEVLTNWKGGVL
jgi:type II secretory pathway pseudopilin PulG